ncbi:MAG TPA: hypothetical protein VGM98_16965 [Schlesneria sp.]|jgi:hypothetical protein
MAQSGPVPSNQREWSQASDWANQAKSSAGEAAMCASEVASHAAAAVGATISQKADDLVAQAGAGVHALGDRIAQQLPQEGMLGGASQAVVDKVRQGGDYLQEQGLSGLSDDLSAAIRSNPLPAVLIAMGIGWYIGRNIRL